MDVVTLGLLESFNVDPTMLLQFCVPWNAEPGDPCSNAAAV